MLERVFAVQFLVTDVDLQEPLGEVQRLFRSMLTDHGMCSECSVIPRTWYSHVTALFLGLPVLT